MHDWFRLILWILLSSVLPGSFAAQAQTPPSGRISFMIFGDPVEKAAYESVIAAFTKTTPTVSVDLIHIPSQGAFRQRLAADFVAGTPPDVMLINYSRYAGFARRGQLAPLDDMIANSKLIKKSDFYQEALAPFTWENKVLCLPQNVSSLVVYYNKTLFQEAGLQPPSPDWRWEDFLRAAQALTRAEKNQFGLGTQVSMARVAPFIWQNGGQLVDRLQFPTRLTMMTEQGIEAVQWFVDLAVKHKVMPDPTAEKAESSESRFQSGRMGMYLNSRARVPALRRITGFEWDVAPLPRAKQQATILHSDGFCMAEKSTNKPAAAAFIEFAMSVEGQTLLAKTGRTVPSLRAVANSPAFLDPNVLPRSSKVFLDVIPGIRAAPVVESWPDIEDAFGKELERAMAGQVTAHQAIAATIERTFKFFGD
ncbi:MAG: sugar ABC transporter substrate-binding protein [Hyphomicrobiales bacterium]|nr:sugar ABC transporter substrate-binding protein [Hyphomicrobiales bacterium]